MAPLRFHIYPQHVFIVYNHRINKSGGFYYSVAVLPDTESIFRLGLIFLVLISNRTKSNWLACEIGWAHLKKRWNQNKKNITLQNYAGFRTGKSLARPLGHKNNNHKSNISLSTRVRHSTSLKEQYQRYKQLAFVIALNCSRHKLATNMITTNA